MIKVKIEGLEGFNKAMLKLGVDFEDAVEQGVALTAQEVRTESIKLIQEKSSGKQVKRQKQGGGGTYDHTAASAGNAPNTDTGNLVSSIQTEKDGELTYKVGATSKAKYAGWLEFGTKNMAARPWLSPALESKGENLRKNIEKSVGAAIMRLKK